MLQQVSHTHKGDNNHLVQCHALQYSQQDNLLTIDKGDWLDDQPYYVIHRVASVEGVHGVMADIINYCSAFTFSIRIDTHADNRPMQASLIRLGFVYCGIIYVENGDSRLAFQCIFQYFVSGYLLLGRLNLTPSFQQLWGQLSPPYELFVKRRNHLHEENLVDKALKNHYIVSCKVSINNSKNKCKKQICNQQ